MPFYTWARKLDFGVAIMERLMFMDNWPMVFWWENVSFKAVRVLKKSLKGLNIFSERHKYMKKKVWKRPHTWCAYTH